MIRAVPAFLILLFAVCAAVFVLSGCGDDEAAGLNGELRYVRSGGIAGTHDELTVRPDGTATLKARGKGERTFELSDDELPALAAEAETLDSVAGSAKPVAPDSFTYTVDYDGRTATTTDPELGASAIKPLVVQLEKILQAHGG
jgi:hypothetical protein